MRLLDALASHTDPVSLKESRRARRLHPSTTHRILNDLASAASSTAPRPAATGSACGCWSWATWSRPGSTSATRRCRRCASCTARPGSPSTLAAPGRRDRLHRARLQRALGHAGGAGHRRPRPAAPDIDRQAVPRRRRTRSASAPTPRAPDWPATRKQHHPLPAAGARVVQGRQYGIARDNEELELGVRCMAAGIYDDQGRLVAGLSISAPADRLQDSWLNQLSGTALEISRSLGYRPEPSADSQQR